MRVRRQLPQVWVRLAVVTSRCSRIPSSDDGLIAVCSASRDECDVGQPMAARLLLTQPGGPSTAPVAVDVIGRYRRRLTTTQAYHTLTDNREIIPDIRRKSSSWGSG